MATKCTHEDFASKTIRISLATYQDLAKLGRFGDSFDSVIRNLLLNSGNELPKEEHYKTAQKAVHEGKARPEPEQPDRLLSSRENEGG